MNGGAIHVEASKGVLAGIDLHRLHRLSLLDALIVPAIRALGVGCRCLNQPRPGDTAIIRASVRECLKTWRLQTQVGPVTVETLETILARATVPILRQLEERAPELMRCFRASSARCSRLSWR